MLHDQICGPPSRLWISVAKKSTLILKKCPDSALLKMAFGTSNSMPYVWGWTAETSPTTHFQESDATIRWQRILEFFVWLWLEISASADGLIAPGRVLSNQFPQRSLRATSAFLAVSRQGRLELFKRLRWPVCSMQNVTNLFLAETCCILVKCAVDGAKKVEPSSRI